MRIKNASGWEAPLPVSNRPDPQANAAVAVVDRVFLVWSGRGWAGQPAVNLVHRTWTDPFGFSVEELITSSSQNQHDASLAVDPGEGVHVAWSGLGWGTNPGIANVQYRKRISGSWTPQEIVTDESRSQISAALALDESHRPHVVWSGSGSGTHPTIDNILYRTRTADGWQPVERVSDSDRMQAFPSIALDMNNRVTVAWHGTGWNADSYTDVAVRQRVGGSWTTIGTVPSGAEALEFPLLVWSAVPIGTGNGLNNSVNYGRPREGFALVAAASRPESTRLIYLHSDLYWQDPPRNGYLVHTDAQWDSTMSSEKRSLTRTADGRLHAVYTRRVSGTDNIFYASSSDEGRHWTEEALSAMTGGAHQLRPAIAADSSGTLHVVWVGTGWGSTSGYPNLQYRKRTSAGWQPRQPITALTQNGFVYLSTAIDSRDQLHIAWSASRPGEIAHNIHYIRSSGAVWTPIEYATVSSTSQFIPSITVDRSDRVHLVWTGHGWGSHPSYLNVQHRVRDADGWGAQESVTDNAFDHYWISSAIDASDRLHTAWSAQTSALTGEKVQYRMRTAEGWQAEEPITNEINQQLDPSLSVEADGTVHLVWHGYTRGVVNDMVWNILHRKRTNAGWQPLEALTDASEIQGSPSLLYSPRPVISGLLPGRPKTGFALLWTASEAGVYRVKYLPSDDLTWDGGVSIPPAPETGVATTLAEAHAYPVPFAPSRGHREIVFSKLTAEATIRIFTIAGEPVRTIHVTDGSGRATWDVRNGKGQDVVSGVYLYVITNGGNKKRGKLAVIR
jgi:hypothetical protein